MEKQTGVLFGESLLGVAVCIQSPDAKAERSLAFIHFTPETKPYLKSFFENSDCKKITYSAKEAIKFLHKEDIAADGLYFDCMIAGYLLNAGGKIGLEELALSELGVDIETATSAQKTEAIADLAAIFRQKMDDISATQTEGKTIASVFYDVEMPLIPVLIRMEERGVYLETRVLTNISKELAESLAVLEQEIYDLAGKAFNINSPKQLAVILFETLAIPTFTIKKLKTGYSTASSELAKLRDDYPIVHKIEQYRELFKLKSTYVDTLPRLVGADGCIHTDYRQEIAATGRLSSKDPNLQNIPASQDWGTRVRGAFEAKKGYVFVGADYSQIELRVAAHLADDAKMIEAFRNKEDIHRATAALIHQITPDEVTDAMRRQAKVLNFGIMYGMGSFGLSQAAGITPTEATAFIKGYFEKFSGMAAYLEGMKVFAREHGFVETEIGRRRYIPEINASNQMVAKGAERMAVNMPIQGLEADIVKLAMLEVQKQIDAKYSDAAFMLLQVHDELIFEVREDIAEAFSQEIKKIMESVYVLKAPLVVDVYTGNNWGEI